MAASLMACARRSFKQFRWPQPAPSTAGAASWAQTRGVWNERVEIGTAVRAESFYDSTVERVGSGRVVALALAAQTHPTWAPP
jgi:hypothetical protein